MKIEKQFQPLFEEYQRTKSPDSMRKLVEALQPTIDKGLYTFGKGIPSLVGKAKLLAMQAIQTYNPKRGNLTNHVMLNLQRLQRLAPQVSNVITVPEGLRMHAKVLNDTTKELEDKLGRPPSDQELADHVGLSLKKIEAIRKAQGAATESAFQGNVAMIRGGEAFTPDQRNLWVETVYKELPPPQQYILENRFGLHGRPIQTLEQIAKKLGLSVSEVYNQSREIENKLSSME